MLLLQLLLHLRGLFSSAGAWTSFHLNSLRSQSTVALLANDVTHQASYRFEILVHVCLRASVCVFTVHIKDFSAASQLAISTRAAEKQLSAKWRKKIIQWNKYTSVKTHAALDECCTTLHQQQIKNLNHDKNKQLHFYHWIYCIRSTSKS